MTHPSSLLVWSFWRIGEPFQPHVQMKIYNSGCKGCPTTHFDFNPCAETACSDGMGGGHLAAGDPPTEDTRDEDIYESFPDEDAAIWSDSRMADASQASTSGRELYTNEADFASNFPAHRYLTSQHLSLESTLMVPKKVPESDRAVLLDALAL